MIKQLTLRNFKSIKEQTYDFTDFDLLVGRNNCGKSTALQALAIWQFCVDEFHRSKREGSRGIQVVLPNFTALPIPEFNLLWKDKTDRIYSKEKGEKGRGKQEYILIEIIIKWTHKSVEKIFGVQLRYQSPQAIFAIPLDGWSEFKKYEQENCLPRIAYVPPFSGLEPIEKRLDISPIRQQVGKGQPGSVLRNLLLRVNNPSEQNKIEGDYQIKADYWNEFSSVVERWFGVKILPPQYNADRDVNILVQYQQNNDKKYDIISGGSGFHQTLTLLAFLYGYQPTTILLDEPDAHLHVNLQREILDYFKRKSGELNIQFLVATHAEEFVRGVDASQIISLLIHENPKRIQSTPEIVRAMAEVTNEEIVRLLASPYIVYIEGESDERILRAWANACKVENAMDKVSFKLMSGGGKENMKLRADEHFSAVQQIIPDVKRLMLFDYDSDEQAFHPKSDNPSLAEWKRKNIENYLLVPDAWKRAVLQEMQCQANDLFAFPILQIIEDFFAGENLTLPRGKNWQTISASIFSVVDGKRILFENREALFYQLRNYDSSLTLQREKIAQIMIADEIHEDVHQFMNKLRKLVDK
jgi:AAA15 family ATPase/GTPase